MKRAEVNAIVSAVADWAIVRDGIGALLPLLITASHPLWGTYGVRLTGSGTLVPDYPASGASGAFAIGDLNGDGKPDLAALDGLRYGYCNAWQWWISSSNNLFDR